MRFLIEHHLDMSATMQRRDIFDPATVTAVRENGRNTGTTAATDAAYLRGYSRGESGSTDAVESGNVVATFCGHRQSFQPQRWTATGCTLPTEVSLLAQVRAQTRGAKRRQRSKVSWKASRGGIWRCIRRRKSRSILRCTRN